jgi:molecular chaperone DnaK
VLPRNTRLPATKRYELATVKDGQQELELTVFQGDSAKAAECEYLGTVKVDGLPAAPKGAVRVAVEFALGAEGILSVSARDLATGAVTRAELATREAPEDVRRKLQMPDAPSPPRGARPVPPAPPPPLDGGRGRALGRLFARR